LNFNSLILELAITVLLNFLGD